MSRPLALLLLLALLPAAELPPPAVPEGSCPELSIALGRPTDRSIAISVLSAQEIEAEIEFGDAGAPFSRRSSATRARAGVPTVIELAGLAPGTAFRYRLLARPLAGGAAEAGPVHAFHTARAAGSRFVFTLQGDSHPERPGTMFSPALYERTLRNVAQDRPDFHIALGDDFSIERLIERQTLSQAAVDQVYARQRAFLGIVSCSSPLFLVNGNHEQAARIWLDGGATNPGVLAGRARNAFFPLPAPDGFYSGDGEVVPHIGLLRDYYAWEWGDALIAVIDPYWHSPVQVDHDRRGGKEGKGGKDGGAAKRDLWQVGIGEAQYRWLHDTLLRSRARWKFVLAHHVMGTGRGGIEEAGFYEWGGRDRSGADFFAAKRPGWELPIHQLFVRAGVTAFFQGHDHLFARQELDGVAYISVPNPADDTATAFNREAYRSGEILPNAGHLRVVVEPERVRLDYVRAWLPQAETAQRRNGAVAFSAELPAVAR